MLFFLGIRAAVTEFAVGPGKHWSSGTWLIAIFEVPLRICRKAIDLLPAVGNVFQKHRHVVVGILPSVATPLRAEPHHPLDVSP